MHYPIGCERCGKKSVPKGDLIGKPDGSRWIHYDCEAGHSFHRTPAGDPVRFALCDCEALVMADAQHEQEREAQRIRAGQRMVEEYVRRRQFEVGEWGGSQEDNTRLRMGGKWVTIPLDWLADSGGDDPPRLIRKLREHLGMALGGEG